ncbi:MAG: cyclic lactone autoinducer peptide [Clostridia bacterium]|nr:cyclic lactone autoinducer peptide [Clostridia bacterium]
MGAWLNSSIRSAFWASVSWLYQPKEPQEVPEAT